MSFNEIEEHKYKKIIEDYLKIKRPPENIRDQIDIDYNIDDQSIIIYTNRPSFDDESRKVESPNIKFTYIKKNNVWKIYWLRANMKWVNYEPSPEFKKLENCIKVLDKDSLGCFWG